MEDDDFIEQAKMDVYAYEEGYGELYHPNVVKEINKLDDDICKELIKNPEDKECNQILEELRNNDKIKKKKGIWLWIL